MIGMSQQPSLSRKCFQSAQSVVAPIAVAKQAIPGVARSCFSRIEAAKSEKDTATCLVRRSLLAACYSFLPAITNIPGAKAARKSLQQDPRLAPLQQYWHHLVTLLQPQLSADFSPSLVFYGPGELLPSGAPGDPALEYNTNRRASCGLFTSGFSAPYAVCPTTPGGLPSSDLARDCCRHLAYCVPRSRFALAALDRQSSVVASPRLAAAADQTWQGVLVHEMGHCIDFWTFPERYRLPALLQPPEAAAAAALALIDQEELDAEIRADRMANALLTRELGAKLCYNMATHVQELVEPTTRCLTADEEKRLVVGNGQTSSEPVFTTHFPHPPVSAG